jgi:hypothetical protein
LGEVVKEIVFGDGGAVGDVVEGVVPAMFQDDPQGGGEVIPMDEVHPTGAVAGGAGLTSSPGVESVALGAVDAAGSEDAARDGGGGVEDELFGLEEDAGGGGSGQGGGGFGDPGSVGLTVNGGAADEDQGAGRVRGEGLLKAEGAIEEHGAIGGFGGVIRGAAEHDCIPVWTGWAGAEGVGTSEVGDPRGDAGVAEGGEGGGLTAEAGDEMTRGDHGGPEGGAYVAATGDEEVHGGGDQWRREARLGGSIGWGRGKGKMWPMGGGGRNHGEWQGKRATR